MVLRLAHSEHVLVRVALILPRLVELKLDRKRHVACCFLPLGSVLLLLWSYRVDGLTLGGDAASKVAHFFDRVVLFVL